MTEREIENELQTLRTQLASLQDEHAKTRRGWLHWMRSTGWLLGVYTVAIFLGLMRSHASIESNPVAIALLLIGLFMFPVALWLLGWSTQWGANKLMRTAAR